MDDETKQILKNGGKVLLLLAGKVEQGKEVVQYMTPAFWNTSWFKMRPTHAVETLINDHHPIFKEFTFHEINFVSITYQATQFDIWNIMPSGLLGPVTIREVREMDN